MSAVEDVATQEQKKIDLWHFVTWKKVCAVLLLTLICAIVYFVRSYQKFTYALFDYARYSTVKENRNLNFCLSYWFDFVGKLKLDEEGFYSFEGIDETNLSEFEKGKLAYHRGEFSSAIKLIESNVKNQGETETKLFWLAMSYMRQAEADNCLTKLISDSEHTNHHGQTNHNQLCALPLTRFHDQAQSARTAAKLFEKLLDDYNEDNRLYRWLLNFNYMTVNGFPQEVPAKYLIETEFIDTFYGERKNKTAAEYSYLSFSERARELGVDTNNTGRGIAVEDFDQDGFLDIVTGGSFDVLKFYRNEGGKKFSDQTAAVGLADVKQPFFIVSFDYDNDGWLDLFVSRMFGKSYALYRNNHGAFIDVTNASGLLDNKPETQMVSAWTPSMADVDNDGDLDIFLAQLAQKIPFSEGVLKQDRMNSKLFINEQGKFVDRTSEYGLDEIVDDQYFVGAAFGDYDDDGFADLFLSSPLINVSVLLRNIEGKSFAETKLYQRVEGGFSASFIDVNHDGRLDIFQGGFADATTSVEMSVFGEGLNEYHSGHSTILLQTPDGTFQERNDYFDMPMGTMGSSFGDLNNDGCADFYLGTGTPEGWFVLPNLMYLGQTDGNKCAERTTNISMLHGFGTIQKGHGIVFFDFDNDGDQDVYSSLGGMWPADRWLNQFFINESNLNNSWLKIRLRGRKSNYYGIGARIKVIAENSRGEEIIRHYLMDQKTSFGSPPYLAHIGLMDADKIKEVEVYWTASGCRKKYRSEMGKLNVLDESECFGKP